MAPASPPSSSFGADPSPASEANLAQPLLHSSKLDITSYHEEEGEEPQASVYLSIDDVLRLWVGEFGPAQFLHFFLCSLAWTLEALQTMFMIFADQTPSWTCSDGSCSSSSSLSALCTLDPSLWEWTSGAGLSTVSEFGLICGQYYKVGLVQSFFFAGALVGAGVFGSLSDSRLGRKGTLALASILNGITGMITVFSPNYWAYFVLRTASGFSSGGLGLSSFVLATELVGPSRRGPVGMSTFYFFATGIMMLSGIALFSPSWRHLCIITSIPSLLYCLLIVPFLKESPRWYLVQGKHEKAMEVLHSIAKRNGTTLPAHVGIKTEQGDEEIFVEGNTKGASDGDNKAAQASGSILDVMRIPVMRVRMLVMVFIWLCAAVVYYGVSLNVTNLGTNLSLSVFLNATAEVPAFAITAIFLEKLGRRVVLVTTLLLGGVCCLVGALVPDQDVGMGTNYHHHHLHHLVEDGHAWVWAWHNGTLISSAALQSSIIRLACGVVAIFGMAGAYNLLYIYTAELFPTVVRNAALGLTTQAAQVGAIVAPMIVVLGKVHSALPFVIFSVASFMGGLLALRLPETLHCPMYETLEGVSTDRRERREEILR